MILAAVIIAKNPAKYGFEAPALTLPTVETVEIPPAVDLRRIAEWAGVSVDDIQRLNPELRRWTTPIRGADYELNVPEGTAGIIRERLTSAAPGSLNALQWHTVKRGETLSSIARKLRVSRADLAEANYLRTTSRVATGQKLLIPRMPSAAVLARAANGTPTQTAATDAVAAVLEETPVEETVIHRVRSGDTLFGIAKKYSTTVEQLKALNRLSSSRLKIGTRLVVATPRAANAQQQ
jgi:membrane-bound lytic murein transglycosylase D